MTDAITLETLSCGAKKIFNNAESLFHEAILLANCGAIPRAVCLHQISLEECSKIEMLGSLAITTIIEGEVNQKKVISKMNQHSVKNKLNAYMLPPSKEEVDAKSCGDWKGAIEAFKQMQLKYHQDSNNTKNASLYVDWVNGNFIAPYEQITNEMLAEIRERNEEFLYYARISLQTFRSLELAPDIMKDLLSNYINQLKNLSEEKPRNFEEAVKKTTEKFLKEAHRKLKS